MVRSQKKANLDNTYWSIPILIFLWLLEGHFELGCFKARGKGSCGRVGFCLRQSRPEQQRLGKVMKGLWIEECPIWVLQSEYSVAEVQIHRGMKSWHSLRPNCGSFETVTELHHSRRTR